MHGRVCDRQWYFVVVSKEGINMHAIFLHDKDAIRALLLRDPELHIYSIGDLDDFFWPYTAWHTLREPVERPPV
jgi:hypothetical protein